MKRFVWSTSVFLVILTLLSACATPTPQVVKETVVVEKKVTEVVEVEKVVTQVVKETVKETVVVASTPKVVEKEVTQIVQVEVTPKAPDLWYDPAEIGQGYVYICLETPPSYGGTIIVGWASSPVFGSENWWNSGGNDNFIHNQLVGLNMNAQDLMPELAERWEISDDGLVYTFHLRNDVKWHDGELFTAEDIKFTIEAMWHPDTGCGLRTLLPLAMIEGTDEFAENQADEISGVQIVDDFTIQITLKQPRFDFLLGMAAMNVFCAHCYEGLGYSELQESPYARAGVIGTGPFKVEKVEADQYYILAAHEDYFEGRPYLDRIIFRAGLNWMVALEAGEIHFGQHARGPDRERMEANPDIKLVGAPVPGAQGIWPNKERFTDPRVLQALMYALDRQAIVDSIYLGQALVYDYNEVDPGHTWVSPDIAVYDYDPDKARELLAEAGWDLNAEINFITYYQDPNARRVAAAMQQYWLDVGLKVKVTHQEAPTFVSDFYETGDYDLGYGCCTPASIPEMPRYACSNIFPAGYNGPRYCNEYWDELVAKSLVEPDPAKRQSMWHEATEIVMEELPWMPLYREDRRAAISANLCNFRHRQHGSVSPDMAAHTWYLKGE